MWKTTDCPKEGNIKDIYYTSGSWLMSLSLPHFPVICNVSGNIYYTLNEHS